MNVLFVAALFVAACGATWKETLYYPYNYDYSDVYPYNSIYHCSDEFTPIYVTLDLLDSDETCTEYTCTTSSDYNTEVNCLDAVPDDFSDYFTNYHQLTFWNIENQCVGDPIGYHLFQKDACEWSTDSYYTMTYIYYWGCNMAERYMHEYYGYVSDGACTYNGNEGADPTNYPDYRLADCIGDSYYGWWKMQCDADAGSTAQWQVIKYYLESDDTCANDPIYYEYYYTDTCITQACVDDDSYPGQVWSCQDTEPTPLGLVPVGTTWDLLVWYNYGDYTCAGDVMSTMVLPDICVSDGSYYYTWDVDIPNGDANFIYYSDIDVCTDKSGWTTSYMEYFPVDSYDGLVDFCWYDYSGRGWYTLLDGTETAIAGTQTIMYYPTNTSNPVVAIDQYYTDHCYAKVVPSTSWSVLHEVWTCDVLTTPPDLMELMPDGLFAFYYEITDRTCDQTARWTSVMTQECVNDTVTGDSSFYWDCSTMTATSVTLYYYYCYNLGCTSCSSSYSDYGMYSSEGADANYCYIASYSDVDAPFEAHCAPPNPAYQTIEYFAAADATDATKMTYAQSYYTDFCAELTQTGEYFFESWTCSATAGDPTTYFDSPFYAVKYTEDTCTTEAKYWEAFNPLCVGDSRTGVTASYAWACEKTDEEDSEVRLYYSTDSSDCYGNMYEDYSYDGEIYSSYSYTDYCYDDWYSYNSYYKLYCGTESGYQVIKYYADDSNTDANLVSVQVGYTEECCSRGVLGWHYDDTHFTEDWSCVVDEPSPYEDWDDAFVVYYYHDSTLCEDAALETVSSYPRDCVNHGALTESYLVYCDPEDTSVSLKYDVHDVADCAATTPTTNTIIYSSSESTADDCWYYSYYDSFNLACRPPNPAWQFVLASSSSAFDDSLVFMYSFEWSETCYLDEYYDDSLDATISYQCVNSTEQPDPYDRWDNAIVATWYSDSDCTSYVSTDVYLPVDECLQSSVTGITGVAYTCTFNGYNEADLTLNYYSTTTCTGTATATYTVLSDWAIGTSPYCFTEYSSEGYYFLECVPKNPQFQVWTLWSDNTAVDAMQALYANVSYCYEYPGSIYNTATWQTWRCFESEPDWTTVGFTSAPMEVVMFETTDCSGDFAMKMAASVECITSGDYAYWGYCFPREGTITGYGCYTGTGYFEDCVDRDDSPVGDTLCQGATFIDAYTYTEGDTCFDYWDSSMEYMFPPGVDYTYTMSCGDLTTNSVWWTETYVESEGDCTEVSPIESEGYFTRFCGASEDGTCEEQTQDTILKSWYNETCIAQEDILGFAKGCVFETIFTDSECAPEYTYGLVVLRTGCWWDNIIFTDGGWEVDCDHDLGEIYISSGCDEGCGLCDDTEVLYTENQCYAGTGEVGYQYTCAGPSVAVAAVLVIVAVLAALF